MKSKSLLITLLALIISTGVTGQKTWTGTTSTAWNTSTNWSPAGAPGATDNVTIPSAPANQPLISGSLTPVCNNLTINTGASLTISSTLANQAMLTASGNAIINGSLSLTGVATTTLKVVNITWGSGSSMTGSISGGIQVSGNWDFSTGSSVSMGYSTVTFIGSNNSTITSNSANSSFYSLVVNKTGGAIVYIGAASTSALTINGGINIGSGAVLNGQANITTILKGNLVNSGNINMGSGTLSFEKASGTQSVQININDFFNSININTGGTVTISTSYIMQLMGNMTIQAGVLDPAGSTIGLFGNWTNNVGTAGFTEGTGTVIFNGGNYPQYCSSENFYTLEVHKTIGGALRMNGTTVTCSNYNWTAGAIDVLNGGTFTANNITDDAIAGNYYCNPNCTINLYNYGGNIDLRGNLYIYGGDFNVYGGNNPSWWPYQGNASITMSGGVLNFADQGILIRTDASYSLTNNITGGTIKTAGSFTNGRSDFIPAAGTLELAGTANTNLTMNAGSLFNLAINKATANTVTLATNATLNGTLTVQSGTFLASNKILFTNENISVSNGGTLFLENGAILRVKGNKALTIASGGTLKAIGTSVSKPIITNNASSGYHEFHVYGTISARNAIFEYNYGINIWSTATVDPANPFDQCTFSYGVDRFLLFSNNQELMIRGANFPTVPLYENVWKNNNSGRVNFRDATGAYAGATFELDPYNRIDWTTTQPGLWTGTVSTDWHTAANWDDLVVPDAAKNVTIPTGVSNMPAIGAAANCNTLTLNGTLTIGNATLVVAGNAAITGNITMTHSSGILTFNNDVAWNSGSTATIPVNSSIRVYGNWDFNAGANVQFGFGTVTFMGTVSKEIRSYSANCAFYNISINKTGGANAALSALSTQPLTVNSNFRVESGSLFKSYSNNQLIINTNILVYGTMQCEAGTVKLDGSAQSLMPNVNDYFNHLVFSQTGTASMNTTYTSILNIKGDLHIDSGVFDAGSGTINVGGNWDNNVGSAAFAEGDSRVVFNGGNYHQYVWNDETFKILEVNKPLGGAIRMDNGGIGKTVICNVYDWSAGAIDVRFGGTFTANDLADDAIAGSYYCSPNSTINLTNIGGNIDLRGNLTISGGVFNVYGGINQSWWPYLGNASITMSGGLLNFADQGILIRTDGTYTFTSNITGGTIKTAGNFTNGRSDFNPAAGTVELYGSANTNLTMNAGSLYNLAINKATANTATLATNATINGTLTVQSGTFLASNKILFTNDNISVNNGGTFSLESGAILRVKGTKALTIDIGGTLRAIGTSDSKPIITNNASSGFHEFHVNGTISARNAIFEYNYGINIWSTATVDPLNPFDQCTFSYGVDRFLLFSNSQELIIRGANFPTAPVYNNVWKQNNAGSIEFRSATGAYAGAAYENDPYNLISWTTATPGLWTGRFSTSWMTPENWDNNMVPGSSTDVVIPQNVPNMPVLSNGTAYCRDLILEEEAQLTLSTNSYLNVYRDFDSYDGQFTMNGSSFLYFTGSENTFWHVGYNDSYTNIRVSKDLENIAVESQGDLTCSGTFEIREGTYTLRQTLTVTNTGANAFKIEGGGILDFWMPFSYLEVYGSCMGYSGSVIQGNGGLGCKGDFTLESFNCDWWFGALGMIGDGTQFIDLQDPVTNLYGIIINKPSGICYIKSGDLSAGSISIWSGTLSCNNGPSPTATYDILCDGDFVNQAGPAGFDASTGKITFNFWGFNIISPNGTVFNTLEINTSSHLIRIEGEVSCANYDWTSGGIEVEEGATFTVNDVADAGIYGRFICRENGTINLMNPYPADYIDLYGELYNYGGTINISGSRCNWPAASYAKVVMTSGTIDIDANYFNIINTPSSVFIDSISGGTIRTTGSFYTSRPDFTPEGGTIEMYGDHIAAVSMTNGSAVYNLTISNKGAHWTSIFTDLNIDNDFTIQNSEVDLNSFTINLGGNWNNLSGPVYFNEMTGRVRFTGIKPQYCSTEEFNILEIDKPVQKLYNMPGAAIYCESYDWTNGGLWIDGTGSFYAADLADNGIYGSFTLYGNSIELHQDAAQTTDLVGDLNINNGQFTISGGLGAGYWGGSGNASLIMTGGVLDITDYGINITASYPYNFTGNINGGTIRTQGVFFVNTSGFSPTGGEVEIYGAGNPMVGTSEGGSLWNLRTSKSSPMERLLMLDTRINNNFTVEEGLAEVNFGAVVECGNQLEIQAGGWLAVNSGTLEMHNLASVNALENSRLAFYGYPGALARVRSKNTGDSYTLTAHSGAMFEASYTTFEHLPVQGVYIDAGATINPAYAFANCEFRNGSPGGTLLTIDNNQDLVIDNAIFPANTRGSQFNASKSVNQGSVTFVNATGAFAGEAFEGDPFNRIHWGAAKQLNLTLFLEGLYNGTNSMRQASDESGPQFGAGIADQITVELRNAANYNTIVHLADHVNLNTNGTVSVTIPGTLSGSYYITIRHRNSVTTTTAAPVSFASGTISYFFNQPSQAYGGNLLQMITGQFVIFSGDVNQDGIVDTGDITPVDNDAANYAVGYIVSDVNGDGITDTADMTIVDNNAAGYVGAITP
ncbi:MAG: hypothetical protein AB9834_14365 [Lentimicrobium sp.]